MLSASLLRALAISAIAMATTTVDGRQRPDNPFPGGANPDGSLRPTPPLTRLFTQDAYTEYAVENGQLVFARTMKGLRNTVLLPASWEVAEVSQSATIGRYEGRAFVALINLNAENDYTVRIRGSRAR